MERLGIFTFPNHHTHLDLITLIMLGGVENMKLLVMQFHPAVPPSWTQMSSSAPYYRTPSAYLLQRNM
jgi:hypothetical protein